MITDDTAQKMFDFLNSTKIDLSELIQTHFSTLASYFIQHSIKQFGCSQGKHCIVFCLSESICF